MKTNTLHKTYFSVLAALFLYMFASFNAFSQNRKENIEAMKVSFITQKLNLMPDEAKVFWPLYNQYQAELDGVRDARKKIRASAKEDFSSVTDAEVEKLVDSEISFKQSELDIQKKYHAQFKKVLPMKKVAMLYQAEDAFKKKLIEILQEQKGK